MPDALLTPAQFAQTIKAKYPDYAGVPDDVLAQRMLDKFPEYRDRVIADTEPAAPQADWSTRAGLHAPTDSRVLGFLRGSGTALVDMAEGATAGLASTVYHGGDLIRRAVGANRVIDTHEAQQAMHAPETVAGQMGYYGEQGAEFAVPLSKLSKAAQGERLLTRALVDAAGSAGVAGAQSGGDTDQMSTAAALGAGLPIVAAGGQALLRGASGAAAGAAEGGMGGALAGAVRKVVPMDAKALTVQALKPGTNNTGFVSALDRALPEIKAVEAESGKPIETLEDFLTATKQAKQRIRADYDAIAGPKRAMGSTVDLSPVADALVKSIPETVRLEGPGAAQAVRDVAEKYRGRFPLEQAEQFLLETNADLDAYYAKNPAARRVAAVANPDTAQLVAKGKALRSAIYTTLDDGSQNEAARELNRRYGALMDVEQTAMKRFNVARRQQPESLAQQIGKTRAAGQMAMGAFKIGRSALMGDVAGVVSGGADMAAAKAGREMADFLKEQQTSDALVRRAMAAVSAPRVPVVMPHAPEIRGLLPAGPLVTPPPADPSFVRGVPAMPARSERLALPAGKPPFIGTPAETSGGGGVTARSVVQRDPRTGRMRRVYVSDAK